MKKKFVLIGIVIVILALAVVSYNNEPAKPVSQGTSTREKKVTERLDSYYDQIKEKEEMLTLDPSVTETLGEHYTAKLQVFSEDKIFYTAYVVKDGEHVSLEKAIDGAPDVTVSVDEKLIGGELQKNNLNAQTLIGLFLSQRIKVTPLTEIPKLVELARKNADDFWLRLSGVQIGNIATEQ